MESNESISRRNSVAELVRARRETGSKPGARSDGRRLALAIEGGGMRGVVSGAMVAALEQMGTLNSFDAVYGSSAGAISGAYFIAQQARYGVTIFYEDINNSDFIDFRRLFRSKSIVSLEFLLDTVCAKRKILDCNAVLNSPIKLNMVAASVSSARNVVLKDFRSAEELMEALRASSRIPYFAGPPVPFRGDYFLDASIYESIPCGSAAADGFTDIVALLTRPSGTLRSEANLIDRLFIAPYLSKMNRSLGTHYLERGREYRKEIDEICHTNSIGDARILPIQIPVGGPKIAQLEKDRRRLLAGAIAGYKAAYHAIEGESPDVVEIITPVKQFSRHREYNAQ